MPSKDTFKDRIGRMIEKRQEREKIAAVAGRVLPEDLRAQILDGIEKERALITARIELIDSEVEKLRAIRHDLQEQRRAALKVIERPGRTVTPVYGASYQVKGGDRGARQVTPEAVRLRGALARLETHLRDFAIERNYRLGELRELRALEAQTQNGLVTSLSWITARFKSGPVHLGELAKRAKIGGSFEGYSDMFGNPLPPEALNADGQPAI